jgi:hypothetical protein
VRTILARRVEHRNRRRLVGRRLRRLIFVVVIVFGVRCARICLPPTCAAGIVVSVPLHSRLLVA